MKSTIRPIHLALLAVFVAGCATPPPPVSYPPPAPRPPPPAPVVIAAPVAPAPPPVAPAAPAVDTSANERMLVAATDAYDRGEFASAVRQLTPLVSDGSLDSAQLLRALKTLAFSQCSTNAITACRQSFERALKADPSFDLLPAERGHPVWGAQFARAKRTVLGK